MFEHTSVDRRNRDNLREIKDHFLDSGKSENLSYLSSTLGLKKNALDQYNSWYKIDDKLYYFKSHFIFNELFLSELIKQYNLKSVTYEVVRSNGILGIMSESIKNKKSKYFDYDLFFQHLKTRIPRNLLSLEDVISTITTESNKEELMNAIYRLTAFDWFSGQSDRSDTNVVFEQRNGLHLAPIYDNGSALHYIPNQNGKYDRLYTTYYSSFDNLSFPTHELEVNEDSEYLFYLINNNYELYDYLCKSLDINVQEVLRSTIDRYKLFVPDVDRKALVDYFDTKKRILDTTLTLAKRYN